MTKPPSPSLPRAVEFPLRDILRGLSGFAHAAEGLLEPATAALPDPLRRTVRTALSSLEGTARRLLGPRIGHDDIRRAADFLRGGSHAAADAGACAAVLAFAWDRLREPQGDALRLMISETVAAARLAGRREVGPLAPADRAARLYMDLRRWHVAGNLPGLPVPPTAEDLKILNERLFAFMVWLLADRAECLEDEVQLLDMALALTRAAGDEALAATDDPAALARHLKSLSDHL